MDPAGVFKNSLYKYGCVVITITFCTYPYIRFLESDIYRIEFQSSSHHLFFGYDGEHFYIVVVKADFSFVSLSSSTASETSREPQENALRITYQVLSMVLTNSHLQGSQRLTVCEEALASTHKIKKWLRENERGSRFQYVECKPALVESISEMEKKSDHVHSGARSSNPIDK